jgi:mono/diheme cytochrome c family protein
MLRTLSRMFIAALALAGVIALVAGLLLIRGGISAKATPGEFETTLARRARTLAIPRSARDMRNPVPLTPQVLAEGREHFADHCAICHGNDGSGDTEVGRGLYPRAPDMRQPATQSLPDGELFYIIENGVRLTGMPAWASHEGTDENWHLVHFIRHLPKLTPAELEEMKTLNPKAPDERREEEQRPSPASGSERPSTPLGTGPRTATHPHKHGSR